MLSGSMMRIEMLSKDNFDTWKIHMKALLIKNDAWQYVNGAKVKPEEGNEDAVAALALWEEHDSKAMSDIFLSIHATELKQVKDCNTSRELWQKLESIYQSKGPARKANLLKQIVLQRMHEGDDVRDHLRRFFDAVDRLKNMEVEINDDLLSILLLYSLPSSYENFRIAIETRDELPRPETLRIKVTEESDARFSNRKTAGQNALLAEKQYQKKDKKESRNTSFKCFKCKRIGHRASECRSKPKSDRNEAHKNENLSLYIAPQALSAESTSHTSRKMWCLDSGCTSHLCNQSNSFLHVDSNHSDKLSLADSNSTEITAKGSAKLTTRMNGRDQTVELNDVLLVPNLRTNLLSVGKIVDKGFRVLFEKESAQVLDRNNRPVMFANRVDGLFYVDDSHNEEQVNTASIYSSRGRSLMDWHKRMGHLNEKDLRNAIKYAAVRGLDVDIDDTKLECETCIQGKMVRKTFPKKSERTSKPGEIIHTDLCGPMKVTSNGNAKYFVTFIDDATRWCEIRFIRHKNEAFKEFRAFKNMIETQYNRQVKMLQSDNGTEFINEEFDSYLRNFGIQRRLTVPNNPEQNGVAERKNRSLIETGRCLLLQSNLPPSFWAEAVSTANYIRNRCPSATLKGRTPHETWIGEPPDVSKFEEFGHQVYCLNRTKSVGKFEPRARKGIFLGFAENSKAFRVWIPEERRVEISRDVRFVRVSAAKDHGPYEDFYMEQKINTESRDLHSEQESTVIQIFPTTSHLDVQQIGANIERQEDLTNEDDEEPLLDFGEPENVNHGDQTSSDQEGNAIFIKREPGRPRKVHTGKPGRPRKEYNTTARRDTEDVEFAGIAEVPLRSIFACPERDDWMVAMADEFISIIKNDTWDVIDRPPNSKVVDSRIVLRNKYGVDGKVVKRKARVVARGFSQRPGLDYNQTYAPVARLSSLRLAVAMAARHNMHIRQFDITTAFLNGTIDEEIIMQVPDHADKVLKYIVDKKLGPRDVVNKASKMLSDISEGYKVCKMRKALYGLKQAGRCWYRRLNQELVNFGATPTNADTCVYVEGKGDSLLIIVVYVDDIMAMSRNPRRIEALYNFLKKPFEIKDLGDISYCLGLEFTRDDDAIYMNQRKYIKEILDRFGMTSCKPVSTPMEPGTKLSNADVWDTSDGEKPPYRELVGALMYLSVGTRPDISHITSVLSQYNNSFGETHWRAAKRVLRYLQGTLDLGLTFSSRGGQLTGYVDADWATCLDDRRSYTGYVFTMCGGPVSWESRKQRTVALSSTEAEYMGLSEASKEAIHLRRLAKEVGDYGTSPVIVYNDNQGAGKLAENPVYHSRTKHIDVRHHFVRGALAANEIKLEYMSTDKMPADVLTKGLGRPRHFNCLRSLGMDAV